MTCLGNCVYRGWHDIGVPMYANVHHRRIYSICRIRLEKKLLSYPEPWPEFLFTALAGVSCFRSLAGFGFPLFGPAMFNALGYGKGCTILACVAILLGWPAYARTLFRRSCEWLTHITGPGYSGNMENEFVQVAATHGNQINQFLD